MKRVFRVVAIGVCLGAVLLVVQRGFGIDEGAFLRGYWVAAPAVVIAAVLVNVLYNVSYQRRMRRIVPLLESGRAEEYVAGMEGLLQTARGETLRNILKLNLAAGYMEMRRYDTAGGLLEELAAARLPGAVKMVHRLNFCICCFRAGQCEKGMALYRESQEIFRRYRGRRTYGGNIAEADILAAMGEGRYDRAEALLTAAREHWSDPRLQEDFCRLGELLAERKTQDGPQG